MNEYYKLRIYKWLSHKTSTKVIVKTEKKTMRKYAMLHPILLHLRNDTKCSSNFSFF